MLPRTYDAQTCSVARTLEVVGERWTLLILRDAFLGIRRFDDFQARLDVSRTVLARRLADLVEHGLLRRERYQRQPDRHEYLLTEKALELWPALAGLAQWGTAHLTPDGAPREFVHDRCGTRLQAQVRCPHCDEAVTPDAVLSGPGPGHRRRADLPEALADELGRRRPLLTPVRG